LRYKEPKAVGIILVVEDQKPARAALVSALSKDGHKLLEAQTGKEGLQSALENEPDIVITDIRMPEMDGMEFLGALKEKLPQTEVILITAYGNVELAVQAMKRGAYDFMEKPIDLVKLRVLIHKALEKRALAVENIALRESLRQKYRFDNIVGASQKMSEIYQIVTQVAPTNATVLITGESGTGKELIANAIHYNSPRRDKPLVKLNCASLSETLLESELFGHEKGAFTGAISRRKGRFEIADGGTLFLDEIGGVSLAVQVKLLRVLQEREFERVGGNETIKVDVRLVTATNKDLKKAVEEGTFREDLFYRIHVVTIDVPPLRERKEDIPPLVSHFINKFAAENKKNVKGVTDEALLLLTSYDYPGNVRELENIIESAVVMATGNLIDVSVLPQSVRSVTPARESIPLPVGSTLTDVEKRLIGETLRLTGGNKVQAAKVLGIGTRTLYRKIKEYNL
jgi:DNA-binding NtrC family response regulator